MRRELRYPKDGLWCVILAAGGSSRLGVPKQLVRYRGRPLLVHAAQLATKAAPAGVLAVLGAEAPRLRCLLRRHCPSIVAINNSRWREGLASSLQTGLGALPADTRAALVLLTDQAKLEPKSLARLTAVWRAYPRRAVAARYAGKIGVPAILPRRLWRGIAGLTGDVGARAILRAGADPLLVDVPEARFDVDTPEDLRAL
jgi:molybdenum cofactor cytidylyltransferase